MTEKQEAYIQSLEGKSNEFFNMEFFGQYSFEYAYRLLLVYLSTQRSSLGDIRAVDPKFFDLFFKEDIMKAIRNMAEFRGIDMDDALAERLTSAANDSLVLYLKSAMREPPVKVAHSVTALMDQYIRDAMGDGSKLIVPHVFSEEA